MFAKLAMIAEAETERLRRWVYVIHALFERHFSEQLMSNKGLPVVGPEELGDLMTEGLSLVENPPKVFAPPTDVELSRFVKFMDKDQDGLIDEQELICFCVQGLRQTPEANLAFASRSPMHAKLIGFLEAINSFSGADEESSTVPASNVGPPKRDSRAAKEDLAQYKQSETQPAAVAPAGATPEPVAGGPAGTPTAAPAAQPAAVAEPATAVAEPAAAVAEQAAAAVAEPAAAVEPAAVEPAP
jgi:hypothetical protein